VYDLGGGIDFDEAVVAHVREAVGNGLGRLDPEEPAAHAAVAAAPGVPGADRDHGRVRGGHLSRVGALAAAAVAGVALAACGGDGNDGYGPDERSDFVAACAAGASEKACGCFYDRLADEVPHERFEQVDEQIRADPTAIPDDVADLAVDCSASQPDLGG
jgi:hypothetical protein